MYLEGTRVPGVTYDLRLDPGAGADGSDRVSVTGGGHRTQVDLRADEVVGTAGVTRRLGPRDYVVVASTSVDGVTIQRRADDDLEGGSTTGRAELGDSGLRVFAVRFDRTVRAADVVGTLASDESAHRVLSALPDGRPGPAQSAPVPGHDAVLYVDEALAVIGVEEGRGVSAPLTGTDLVALSWGRHGDPRRRRLPEGADAVSATARWSAPDGSGGEADAVLVTLSGGRRAWFAELPSPDLDRRATASLRWTDADGVVHGEAATSVADPQPRPGHRAGASRRRRAPFGPVGAEGGVVPARVLDVEAVAERQVEPHTHRGLGVADPDRRVAGDARGELEGRGARVVLDPVGETDPVGLLGVEPAGGEDDVGGPRPAHPAGEQLGAPAPG